MKDCNLILMVLSYFLSPGAELDRTLGTRLEEAHQALARKNNHVLLRSNFIRCCM